MNPLSFLTILARFRFLSICIGFALAGAAAAHDGGQASSKIQMIRQAPASVAVQGELPTPPKDVIDLKFHEFFKMPVGPRGLEPSDRLLSLDGKRVRVIGYMTRQENPVPGVFILAPLPVVVADEDESLADDLPPSSVFVHLEAGHDMIVPYVPGLIRLTGILSVGGLEEADGRVSAVRLLLDSALAEDLMHCNEQNRISSK